MYLFHSITIQVEAHRIEFVGIRGYLMIEALRLIVFGFEVFGMGKDPIKSDAML